MNLSTSSLITFVLHFQPNLIAFSTFTCHPLFPYATSILICL